MKLEQSFEVAAPVDRVWRALTDVEQVAPCLPGAAVTGRNDDGSYNGTFTVKIGPTTASYSGKLEMQDVNEGSHTATMQAQGSDKRGQGGATATIRSRLESLDAGRTRVDVDTDYHITGRLARFGRGGMIEDISERLLKEFAKRLQESLEGSGSGEGVGETAGPAPTEAATEEPAQPAAEGADPALPPLTPAGAGGAPGAPPPPPPAEPPPPPAEPAPPPAEAPPAEPPPPPAEAPPPPAEAPPPPAEPPPPPAKAPPPPPRPPAQPSEPLQGGSLVGSVLLDRVKANPWPLVATVFVLWRLLRRRR